MVVLLALASCVAFEACEGNAVCLASYSEALDRAMRSSAADQLISPWLHRWRDGWGFSPRGLEDSASSAQAQLDSEIVVTTHTT